MTVGQTSYSQSLAIGRAGMLADNTTRDVISRNNSAGAIPFGFGVCQGTADTECALPASDADVSGQGAFLGVAIVDLSQENQRDSNAPSYITGEMVAILKKGRCFVTVEENVTPKSKVFCRTATDGGSNTTPGSFRASADGTVSAVAQVITITPTAVNSTVYSIVLGGIEFQFTSSGSATATNIVTGLKAALAAAPGPIANVTATGTSTLVLTATTAGVPLPTVTGDDNLAIAYTTANVSAGATASQVFNARYLTTALAGAVAVLEVNLP